MPSIIEKGERQSAGEHALRHRQERGKLRRVTFVVDSADADVLGDEPIW